MNREGPGCWCPKSLLCCGECDGKREQQDPGISDKGRDGLCRGVDHKLWIADPASATSLQRGLFSAPLSSEEIRYFTLAFFSVPTKVLQTSSSEAERDLSLKEHVKGIIINVQKNKNKLAAKMPIIS